MELSLLIDIGSPFVVAGFVYFLIRHFELKPRVVVPEGESWLIEWDRTVLECVPGSRIPRYLARQVSRKIPLTEHAHTINVQVVTTGEDRQIVYQFTIVLSVRELRPYSAQFERITFEAAVRTQVFEYLSEFLLNNNQLLNARITLSTEQQSEFHQRLAGTCDGWLRELLRSEFHHRASFSISAADVDVAPRVTH